MDVALGFCGFVVVLIVLFILDLILTEHLLSTPPEILRTLRLSPETEFLLEVEKRVEAFTKKYEFDQEASSTLHRYYVDKRKVEEAAELTMVAVYGDMASLIE